MLVADALQPGLRELGLADDAVGYSTTGGHLSAQTITELERYRAEIVAGHRVVSEAPKGSLAPPLGTTVTTTVTVTFDGTTCRHDAPTTIEPGVVRVVLVNTGIADGWVDIRSTDDTRVQVPSAASATNSGYAQLDDARQYAVECHPGFDTTIAAPTLKVR
jgi:hypothetical protein